MPALRIATILPVPFLELEEKSAYHMCLAHLMHVPEYGQFFARMAEHGRFVLMDNGVVETGHPLPFDELLTIARAFDVTQMTLPDKIRDSKSTIELHSRAARSVQGRHPSFMAIPQGNSLHCWVKCAQHMVRKSDEWGVRAIGVTKFLEGMVKNRSDAIHAAGLLESGLDIHLLGTLGDDPTEAFRSQRECEGQLRGVDSGAAAIWTQAGCLLGEPRPKIELDFMTHGGISEGFDKKLLMQNREAWFRAVRTGVITR
jgi:hypothetical protein